jgi:hypothetical protein
MAVVPVAPSWPWPDSTTAIAWGPAVMASDVRSKSAEGRFGGKGPERIRTRVPSVVAMA